MQTIAAPASLPVTNDPEDLSVVIVALNEQGNIGPLVLDIRKQLEALGLRYEVLVVDGGSKDRTREEAEAAGAYCVLQRRLGYGGAVREGLTLARGEYVLTLDADLSHSPNLIPELWGLRESADIVVGSRFVPGGSSQAPLGRKILSRILNKIFSAALTIPVSDSSSGYRLYRRSVLEPARYRYENFNILQEILVKAVSNGAKVREVPLRYLERNKGRSHVQLVRFCLSYCPTLFDLWVLRNTPEAADYEARAYRSRHLIQRLWQRARLERILELLPATGTLLDLGCGSSRFTQSHPEAVALDLSLEKLRYIKDTNPLRAQGDATTLPFADESFDRIVTSQLLCNLENPRGLFTEIRRVLKPGGCLVLATNDASRFSWKIIGLIYRRLLPNIRAKQFAKDLSRFELSELMAENGFRIECCRYVFHTEIVLRAVLVDSRRLS